MPSARREEALKLPDQLLVRYYRNGRFDQIELVIEDAKTRDIVVTLKSGELDNWKHLVDLGWIPAAV